MNRNIFFDLLSQARQCVQENGSGSTLDTSCLITTRIRKVSMFALMEIQSRAKEAAIKIKTGKFFYYININLPTYYDLALHRWYTVELNDCGNIPCPPYVSGREITCAVCIPPPGESGASYLRWGRSVCPTGAEELYKGQAVGSRYSHSGGGANALCLTLSPSWSGAPYNDGVQHGGKLYSVSYQPSSMLVSFAPVSGKAAPCVLCFASEKSVAVFVPGTPKCPSEWKVEYSGYVFAAYYTHHKSDWICVDRDPEAFSGRSGSSYWYPAEIRCGSLRCENGPGKYIAYREVACAVCTPMSYRRTKTYTRWGAATCERNDTNVYSGFAAGAYHSHKGSGASLLCMIESAKYVDRSGVAQSGALLYGVEYETSGYLRGSSFTSLQNYEVFTYNAKCICN